MKRILVLGAPIFQIEVIQKAKEMGHYVGAVDINEDAPALPYADERFICSIRDYDGVLKIAREFHPDGILIGANDTAVVTAARVCEALGLPGHTVETAINATDKVKMLEAFERSDVSHPRFQVVRKQNIGHFEMRIPYPVISKPTDSAGSRGVCVVRTEEELYSAAAYSSKAGLSGDILIEEYMAGPEVSVEVIVVDGIPHILQITDKITSGEPYFIEIGHSQPSALEDSIKERIKELASKAVIAVGLKNSPAHVEIKITEDGPKMVELGARLGGGYLTSYLIDTSVSGINMTESAVKLALGMKPDVEKYHNSGVCAGIRCILAKEGTIKAIRGVEEARKMPGAIKIRIMGKVGQRYSGAKSNSGRMGYVVCRGATTKEALDRCQKALDVIKIEWE